MDKICVAVLNRINSLGTGYKIVSEDELLESFPEGEEKSSAALSRAVKRLCADGFVDVKYSDGNMFCVSALKSYIPEEEKPFEEEFADDGFEDYYAEKPNFLLTFLAAFAGGAAGSLLISLIFALL